MRILCTVIECADGLHADEGRTHSDLLHNIARNIREIAVDDTSVYVIEIIDSNENVIQMDKIIKK